MILCFSDYRVSLAIEPSEKLKSCVESVARSGELFYLFEKYLTLKASAILEEVWRIGNV